MTFLTFHSDYDNNEGGFVATWKAVDISSCPTKTVESVKGTLTSVNYPDMYFDSMNCETIIEAPTYYKWMWIEFDSFVVGSERGGNPIANDCIGDFVQLSMGNISSSYGESFRLCGNLTLNLPNLAFIGEGNSFKLAFHSDVHGNATGFRAHYKARKL